MVQRLKKHVSDNKHRWSRGIFFALLFMTLPLVIEYWFVSVAPADYWFKYYSIEPETQVASPYEVIKFVSETQINQSTPMRWNDVMRCEKPDGLQFFASSYESSTGATTPKTHSTGSWQYPHGLPAEDGTCCWLDSTITVELPFGKTKTQSLLSGKVCIE